MTYEAREVKSTEASISQPTGGENSHYTATSDFALKTKEGWGKFTSATKKGWDKFADTSKTAYEKTSYKIKDAKIDEKLKHFNDDIKAKATGLFSKNKQVTLFGGNLAQICNAENVSIPLFVQQAYKEIEKRSKTLGIFRTSPYITAFYDAIAALEKDHTASLENYPTEIVSSLIKQFIKQLQPKLLTEKFMDSINGAKEVPVVCERLIEQTSLENVILLRTILYMLAAVSKDQMANMMNVNNLAIIFTPNLLPENCNGNFYYIASVEWMITNSEKIEAWFADKQYNIDAKKILKEYTWGTLQQIEY